MFAAWCDLRELVPYAFGYMMSAKVGIPPDTVSAGVELPFTYTPSRNAPTTLTLRSTMLTASYTPSHTMIAPPSGDAPADERLSRG